MKHAFTLAETLITLVIIGVVAALTIPALMQNYKKREYATKLQKFYSTMHQAIQLSTVQNGAVEYWNKKEMLNYTTAEDDEEAEEMKIANGKEALNFINKYILPYMKYLKIEEESPVEIVTSENSLEIFKLPKIYLNDGSVFFVSNGAAIDFIYDVNGDKSPNKEGIDRYRFLFIPQSDARTTFFGNDKQYFGTFGNHNVNTEDYREYIHGCCSINGRYCAELIRLDNWEYKKDYPYKL